jgi:hypothetical protein
MVYAVGHRRDVIAHAAATCDLTSYEHQTCPYCLRLYLPLPTNDCLLVNPPQRCPTQGRTAPPSPNGSVRPGQQGEGIAVTQRLFFVGWPGPRKTSRSTPLKV